MKLNWAVYAGLSALFAGLTAVLAKMGVANVSSNLATFIRTCVILVFAFAIVLVQGEMKNMGTLSSRNWTFLVFSGIATGLSWLFYFAALKSGPVSHVAPIDKLSFVIAMLLGVLVLQEKVTKLTWLGAGFILVGALLTIPSVQEAIGRLFAKGP
jgi:transporter family protein